MISEYTREVAGRLGGTGDLTGNVLLALIAAVDDLENRINNIKECICEDICVEPKKVSAPVNKTTKKRGK